MFFAVLTRVFKFKSLWKLEVELNGSTLPSSTYRILQVEVDFRTVERSVALVNFEIKFKFVKRSFQRVCGKFPILITAHTILWTSGKFHGICEIKHLVNLVDKADNILNLVLNLRRGHKDVCIVLRETSNAQKSAKFARFFVSMHKSKFAKSKRKVAV